MAKRTKTKVPEGIWDLQEGESTPQHEAYLIYQGLGLGRSLVAAWGIWWASASQVAKRAAKATKRQQAGKTPILPRWSPGMPAGYYTRWSTVWQWSHRVRAWDDHNQVLEVIRQSDAEAERRRAKRVRDALHQEITIETARRGKSLIGTLIERVTTLIQSTPAPETMTLEEFSKHSAKFATLFDICVKIERQGLGLDDKTDKVPQEQALPPTLVEAAQSMRAEERRRRELERAQRAAPEQSNEESGGGSDGDDRGGVDPV